MALEARYGELARATAAPLPIAVLYGREDRVLDYRPQGEGFIARVPHARLELVTGGHMLPVTQPARCAEFIRRAAGLA
jgi:pimeloyl-ACP methyl ester carboxylesterase